MEHISFPFLKSLFVTESIGSKPQLGLAKEKATASRSAASLN
jgi:hypothetical protein